MKSGLIILILMLGSSLFFFSFFKKKIVQNDVFIRIENKTNYDFSEILLGKRIIKKDSYKSTSYISRFEGVTKDSMTDYVSTTGKHIGYSKMMLYINPTGYLVVPKPHIQEQIANEDSFADPFENPFSKESIEGYSLNKGYYTFVVSEINKAGFIEIRKDQPI